VTDVDAAVEAVRARQVVILPTDTVYGLCAEAYHSESAERLYRLKGRSERQPTALLASDVDVLFECVPELRGRAGAIVRALLPGPFTLIVPNPAGRFRWLTGINPDAIGVRVPELVGPAREVIDRVGCVAATSGNLPGGPDPARVDDIPEEIRAGAAAIVDAGALPGSPSTVIDFTGPEPRVLREGSAPAAEAIERAQTAVS
jgi:L-threonylcarbamoyladenylate synthase